ncbi:MAG: ABC transporter ATP-binding protein [Proteobacteria bacterium]|nr:ABC transporter ATP-binding protein [Pseudomonadota bacterium]
MGTLQGRALTALLRVEGLTVRYGAGTGAAVSGLDLTVAAGELFVLLGASGSGKTTLLRAVAGFVRPDAGRIVLDGADLSDVPPYRRPVNTMFQSYALFPHMTVAQNVAFGLRGMDRAARAARVASMLDLVSMAGFAARRPSQLSGGQQQRVALARSLAPNPRLLLLDEPLSALDRGLREQTREEIVALQRRVGTAFIVVTHDQQEALAMASRIGVMRDGRLAQVGTPAEVYERPASRFVAEFLGAANVLPARLLEASGQGTVTEVLGVPLRAAVPAPAEGVAVLAIRPERVRLLPAGAALEPNRLAGTLEGSTYEGDRLIHAVRLADGTAMRVSAPLSDGLQGARLPPGTGVVLELPPEACMVLAE